MLNINKKLSHKGFSLIELMVAVVILAMAIFGIFQAYSVGFMGMADARDRTVATNYLQQTIEDFKNIDFMQVKNEPITPIPNTKFSRGTYVLNLEEIDDVVTLKKVISQVRWVDRKGNIKTEKASTIIYNRPATSEVGDEPVKLVLYAQSYYTILPEHDVNLIAEIKDEHGNIYDYDGVIIFSVVTVRDEYGNPLQVGDISTEPPIYANDGVANCIFTAFAGENIEGIERIQAAATVGGEYLTDTVNIRVTTGPVGIVIVPAFEEDRVLEAGIGVSSHIMLYVVNAEYDYVNDPIAYEGSITLSADGPGTLSTTTIASVPITGVQFDLTSNGSPGVVEVTASATDLDMGYTEITFTGSPAFILVTPDKKSIYPGESIGIEVTIVDVNSVQVEFSGTVTLEASSNFGVFDDNSDPNDDSNPIDLTFTGEEDNKICVFTANSDAPPGETITIQANSGDLSGSTDIIILSSLTPKYLELSVWPLSVDLIGAENKFTTITAKIYDVSGNEIVTTYKTPITFYAKIDLADFGTFSEITKTPTGGEAVVTLTPTFSGTAIITASSGDLILTPEEGWEVVFYNLPDHIVLSADPLILEADGDQTSVIKAIVCDPGGNKVANYVGSITFETNLGIFPDSLISGQQTITVNGFAEGEVWVELSSETDGYAIVTANATDFFGNVITIETDKELLVSFTEDISSVLTFKSVSNLDDYEIHFVIDVDVSPLFLKEIKVEWDNNQALLDEIVICSPFDSEGEDENCLHVPADGTLGKISPCVEDEFSIKELLVNRSSDIGLIFSNAKMKDNIITVTFTDSDKEYPPISFTVPK